MGCKHGLHPTYAYAYYHKIVLLAENPYIRRLTPEILRVESGGSVEVIFHVAVNSNGNQWSTSVTNFSFTNIEGQTFPVSFTARDFNYPQQYSLLLEMVEESHAGTYRVTVPSKIIILGCARNVLLVHIEP